MDVVSLIVVVISFGVGVGSTLLAARVGARGLVTDAEQRAARIREDAESRSRAIEIQAQEDALQYRRQVEEESREQRREAGRIERRLEQREEALERRSEGLDRSEQSLRDRQAQVERHEQSVAEARQHAEAEIERVAGMSVEEARATLLDRLDTELRDEAARRVRAMEASAKAEADVRGRKVLATVMQRMTSDITAETTVSVVPIPSDEIKGRIIGREGRNIRAFEAATGCDLIIDDTPEVVTVSGFDPVRREIARVALSRLIQDGRIQPTRIEEAVERARAEVDKSIIEAGEQALIDADVTGLHPEIVKTLGRLRFRYSYGQNQLRHCVETSWLAAAVAAEIGADVEVARAGGLLHDLGKAVDRELEGTHATIGADIAKRFGVPREVVHCIAAHHEEVKPETTEALDRDDRRRDVGQPPGRAPRIRRPVRQAPRGPREHRELLRRRRAVLRHPGRPRGARHRASGGDRRPRRRPPRARRVQEDRGDAAVPRRDQGHRRPRDALVRGSAVTRCGY